MQPIPVPRTLDARSRLLFWESDYVLAAMGGEISAAKARLKLMIVLSEHPELATDRDALEKIFDI